MKLRRILVVLGLIFVGIAQAQEEPIQIEEQKQEQQPLLIENANEYEIAGIEVTGAKRYSPQNVLFASGLKVGDKIVLPGDRFARIIHKLWNYKLFSDIDIFITKTEGDKIFLELAIVETPNLTEVIISGVKKKKADAIIEEAELKKGKTKVDENLIAKTKYYLTNKYKKEGYFNTKIHIATKEDTLSEANGVKMLINIDKGDKIKINKIEFEGNKAFSDAKLHRKMKNTKEKLFGNFFERFRNFWKRSKYVQASYQEDLNSLLDFYKENGYRDARIVSDTLYNDKNDISLKISLEEGKKYYFGDIKFLGNNVYSNRTLDQILGLKKGETYNGVQLKKRISDPTKPDGNTISDLYQNNGYLFSQIIPVEVSVVNDTINFEVRIYEGKPAYFNNITAKGNTITNDKVIYREMRTRPGYIYSKEDILRTMRELSQLGFFDASNMTPPEIKNPDPQSGTVDLVWKLDDTNGSSKINIQGGYGGGSFIGNLGLEFNNFSIQNLFNKKAYNNFLPMGDGQKLSLNASGSRSYQSYSFSFMEPWMGGERPVQFSFSFHHTIQYSYNYYTYDVDKNKRFHITGFSLGLAKRLRIPDDYFQLSQNISYNHYDLRNYDTYLFTFGDGYSNSLAYTASLSRRSSGPNPIFPMGGSDFSITAKVTLPYSLFNNVDYKSLSLQRDIAVSQNNKRRISEIDQQRFKWLEYYKLKGTATWYTNLVDKLVMKTGAEFGYLGAYNKDRGTIPFERFFVGGDGMSYYSLDGREYIAMRGYPNQSLSGEDGDAIYNKFSLELRYPITLKPSASIYALAFAEGANSYAQFGKYNPFELKRSAGVGIRLFTSLFGLLGFDFGYGFDGVRGSVRPNGWETHFTFGQQF